ncbi:MAG: hypothetical protein ACSLFB_07885 [Acidimicrobiales bacterium]
MILRDATADDATALESIDLGDIRAPWLDEVAEILSGLIASARGLCGRTRCGGSGHKADTCAWITTILRRGGGQWAHEAKPSATLAGRHTASDLR